jgi:inner membrane protease ATP23
LGCALPQIRETKMSDTQSSGATAPSNEKPDTGFVPGDDAMTQFRNIYSILTGKMSSEGIEQFRVARDIRNEAADCKRCDEQRDYLLQWSESFLLEKNQGYEANNRGKGPTIRFLSDNIRQLGGDLHSHNIYCRRCTDRKGGGFDPEYGILLCANEMKDQGHLEDTLAHEMVHAYDHLRFKVNWTDNLRHAACTEVGASIILLQRDISTNSC